MRLAPVAVQHWRNHDVMFRAARNQSRTTHHRAEEAVEACETLAMLLADAIRGARLHHLVDRHAAQPVKGLWAGQSRA